MIRVEQVRADDVGGTRLQQLQKEAKNMKIGKNGNNGEEKLGKGLQEYRPDDTGARHDREFL